MSVSNSASRAEPESPSHPTHPGASRYRVFLSYSHADTKWARWLMRRLELYRVPRRFHGRAAPIGEVGGRIAPVFRDRDELPTTSDLGETIRAALRESATLVVICSPSSAKSRWVQEEILAFKRLHGERRVFAFIVSGEPKVAEASDDCFSPALRVEISADGQLSTVPAEVVAADARAEGDGPKLAFVRLIAGLLGVGFDELRQRELQRRNRRLMVITGCSLAGMALTFGLAVVAWQARNDARRRQDQAEDVLAFMLGGFRDELKKIGQLKLLEPVGRKATAYFDALEPRDLTDTSLTRQAKAFTQIGEIRVEEAKYEDAQRAFQSAYHRAEALTRRHPDNGDMLFERGQAESWIAFVGWKRGELGHSREWGTRYRDTATALLAKEGRTPRAQRELISAHHNLAVLEFDNGNYAAARPAFLAEKAKVEEVLSANPGDLALCVKLADIASWLGMIAQWVGNYAEAIERLDESSARIKELVAQEPAVTRWRLKLADALPLSATVHALVGRRAEAAAVYAEVKMLFDALRAQDPKNQQWRSRVPQIQLNQVALLLAEGRHEEAGRILPDARNELERLVAAEPSSHTFTRVLAKAWRFEGALRVAAGSADAAQAAERAIDLGETLFRQRRGDEWVVWELAQANILAGRISQAQGFPEQARARWERAIAVVGPRLTASSDWRFLDSAAQAFTLLGRAEQAAPLIARLQQFGYRAQDPLAAPILDAAPSPVSPPK